MSSESLSGDGANLIFVGGVPRSGTTLVQNMLDSHPEVTGGPEFLHLPDIIGLRDRLNKSVARGHINFYCSSAQVDARLARLIEDFLLPVLAKSDAKYLSEKTPENVLVFRELLDLFPKARFLFVIRDPRAVVASMIKVKQKHLQKHERPPAFLRSVWANIAYIKKCNGAGFSALQSVPERVLPVVYEDLVRDPEAGTRRISEFLGIPWSEKMLKPGDVEHKGEKAITANSGELWYDIKTYYRNPEATSIDSWKGSLGFWQTSLVNNEFRRDENLKACGYHFDGRDEAVYWRRTCGKSLGLALGLVRRLAGKVLGRLRRYL